MSAESFFCSIQHCNLCWALAGFIMDYVVGLWLAGCGGGCIDAQQCHTLHYCVVCSDHHIFA